MSGKVGGKGVAGKAPRKDSALLLDPVFFLGTRGSASTAPAQSHVLDHGAFVNLKKKAPLPGVSQGAPRPRGPGLGWIVFFNSHNHPIRRGSVVSPCSFFFFFS